MKYAQVVCLVVALAFFAYTIIGAESWKVVLITALLDVTSTFCRLMSPMLLMGFSLSQEHSANRLKEGKYKVQCLSLSKVLVAGKIRAFCFDKTGTLTEEGLKLEKVQGVVKNDGGEEKSGQRFDKPREGVLDAREQGDMFCVRPKIGISLSSCHTHYSYVARASVT